MNSIPRIIIMAKAPHSGRCKTRLKSRLGLRGAARLQAHLIRDRLEHALATSARVEVHAAPDIRHPQFLAARRSGAAIRKQRGKNLGQRMLNALGHTPAIIIGTDCPALKTEHFECFTKLVHEDMNPCVPAHDGGYVLIGVCERQARLFHSISWGGNQVLSHTLRQARLAHLRIRLAEPLHDLDYPADYRRERRAGNLPSFY